MNKMNKRPGFTLVELLIVIIIIGILAGMLLLSVGSATDKAEATKIVNAIRNYKSATLMYYADNGNWPTNIGDWTDSLDMYVDRSMDKASFSKISIVSVSNRWLIGLTSATGSPMEQTGVQNKLANQARASALYDSNGIYFTATAGGTGISIYTNMR
jgi:general secretion pathway protein G